MFLITKNEINNLVIPPQILSYKLEEYRFVITKGLNRIEKIGNFFFIDDFNCNYWIFQLEEVEQSSEDLPNGLITLQTDPGFWYIDIQTKNFIDTEWVSAYKDSLFIILENIIQTV